MLGADDGNRYLLLVRVYRPALLRVLPSGLTITIICVIPTVEARCKRKLIIPREKFRCGMIKKLRHKIGLHGLFVNRMRSSARLL